MKHLYSYEALEKLFSEHGSPQLIADQMQTLLYFWRREIDPTAIEALEEEYRSMIRLKLALREIKPIK